jgi:hypothetical protein
VVLESDPDETSSLWQDPERDCSPCAAPLRPSLVVKKFAEYEDGRNGNTSCNSQYIYGGAESEYIRTRKDERARARTEKCVER